MTVFDTESKALLMSHDEKYRFVFGSCVVSFAAWNSKSAAEQPLWLLQCGLSAITLCVDQVCWMRRRRTFPLSFLKLNFVSKYAT